MNTYLVVGQTRPGLNEACVFVYQDLFSREVGSGQLQRGSFNSGLVRSTTRYGVIAGRNAANPGCHDEFKSRHGLQNTAKQEASPNILGHRLSPPCSLAFHRLAADQMVPMECFPLLGVGASGYTDTCRCPLG